MAEHPPLLIRPALPGDEAAWRALWQGYCAFYAVEVSEAVTAHTWARILDAASPVRCAVAEAPQGRVLGFANHVVHDNTWNIEPVCYLEDLFVAPEARGLGVGRALIEWLRAGLQREGWSRLYWVTQRDNATARRLYDRFAAADDFVRYTVRR